MVKKTLARILCFIILIMMVNPINIFSSGMRLSTSSLSQVTPIPTLAPRSISLMGTLAASTVQDVKYELTGATYRYLLTGKTDGMEAYIGKTITVKGMMQIINNKPYVQVTEYKPYSQNFLIPASKK